MNKRLKPMIWALLLLVTAVIGIGATHTVTVQAAVKMKTVKTIPKKMRGTWYHYYKGQGFYKVVIKKHQFSDGFTTQKLDKFSGLNITKFSEKHKYTSYAFRKRTSSGLSAAVSYVPYTKKINGKKHRVLVEPVQSTDEKPAVYTHFKTKHTYVMPLSFQLKRMA
ncbi:hypothetical protein [Levilactobacillus zymae]|uniref:hypothetical protein n=1 Tax=Levilactobacillus zymae TaxID=267363 RepID=UPI0028BA8FD4|nr:hypothetical protein [Levilactobacillus zymae]MDT6980570.1 hypothetical protein [Levilactobacillus zymae]